MYFIKVVLQCQIDCGLWSHDLAVNKHVMLSWAPKYKCFMALSA